jgi:hypothetical protein
LGAISACPAQATKIHEALVAGGCRMAGDVLRERSTHQLGEELDSAGGAGAIPGEVLSRAEIARRYMLAGIEAVTGKTRRSGRSCGRVSFVDARRRWAAEDLNAEGLTQHDSDADVAMSVLRVSSLRGRPGTVGQ